MTMRVVWVVFSWLVVYCACQQVTPEMGEARLLSACMGPRGEDPVDKVEEALEDGADINVQDGKSGQTPLMAAVLRGKVEIVKFLLEKGADVTIGEHNGYTPAHGAGFQGRKEIMQILHQHGDIDVIHDVHEDGYLPFHRACWGGEPRHTETVEYLLDIGVHVNVTNEEGVACIDMTRNAATMELLLARGSKPPEDVNDEL